LQKYTGVGQTPVYFTMCAIPGPEHNVQKYKAADQGGASCELAAQLCSAGGKRLVFLPKAA
jgi:hypothetical protein